MSVDLSNYVEVNERIAAFHEQYPDGSLNGHWNKVEIGEDVFIVFRAAAYRTPQDSCPGVGHAWEPYPGKTPYTKDSELMNAETSAWGRALAALGFEVKRGIASREEVRNRSGNGAERADGDKATDAQRDYLLGKGNRKGLIEKTSLSDEAAIKVKMWAQDTMGKDDASKLIEAIKDDPETGGDLAAQLAGFSDIPAIEVRDYTEEEAKDGDDIPF